MRHRPAKSGNFRLWRGLAGCPTRSGTALNRSERSRLRAIKKGAEAPLGRAMSRSTFLFLAQAFAHERLSLIALELFGFRLLIAPLHFLLLRGRLGVLRMRRADETSQCHCQSQDCLHIASLD